MIRSLVDPSLCMKRVPCEAQGPELMTSPTQDWVCLKTKEAHGEVPCEAGFIESHGTCLKKCPMDMSEKESHCIKETKRLHTSEFSKDEYAKRNDLSAQNSNATDRPLATPDDIRNVRAQRPLRSTSELISMVTLYVLFLIIFVCLLIYFRV